MQHNNIGSVLDDSVVLNRQDHRVATCGVLEVSEVGRMNCWSTASDVVKFFVFGRIISLVYLAPALRGA